MGQAPFVQTLNPQDDPLPPCERRQLNLGPWAAGDGTRVPGMLAQCTRPLLLPRWPPRPPAGCAQMWGGGGLGFSCISPPHVTHFATVTRQLRSGSQVGKACGEAGNVRPNGPHLQSLFPHLATAGLHSYQAAGMASRAGLMGVFSPGRKRVSIPRSPHPHRPVTRAWAAGQRGNSGGPGRFVQTGPPWGAPSPAVVLCLG